MVIAITGATGFIGSALLKKLSSHYEVVALVRNAPSQHLAGVNYRICGDLALIPEKSNIVSDVDVVIHAAARTNAVKELAKANVEGTLNLGKQAANSGTRRFIFLSSIKVNGDLTNWGVPFNAEDVPKPIDSYGVSKMEAEIGLHKISKETGMEVVCIRPPLVYGPGVKGNFLFLLHLVKRGLPLPLKAVHNRRSLVALDNLVDLIITSLDHSAAANQVFLVSDDEDLSTTALLQRLGNALERPARLIPLSPKFLKWGAKIMGKEDIAQRLLASLQVDISKTKNCLNWEPPISINEGLKKTADWYRKQV